MTFIVTLIALLIERFFDWSHLRQWHWYLIYQNRISSKMAGKSANLVLAVSIIPVLILVALIGFSIDNLLYGFAKLLFELFVLLYCLGPRNLWADAFSCVNALTQGDANFAADKLKSSFNINEVNQPSLLHRHFLNDIFIEANRRVFAVVFWYVLLGPVGAILYRLVSLSAAVDLHKDEISPLQSSARMFEAVLDWVPVRIFTFIFALGGHFVQVLNCWRKKFAYNLLNNELLLTECGAAALGYEDQLPEDGSAEKNAIGLLDRSFVILLVVIAISVLLI